jgi:hypothetical protein
MSQMYSHIKQCIITLGQEIENSDIKGAWKQPYKRTTLSRAPRELRQLLNLQSMKKLAIYVDESDSLLKDSQRPFNQSNAHQIQDSIYRAVNFDPITQTLLEKMTLIAQGDIVLRSRTTDQEALAKLTQRISFIQENLQRLAEHIKLSTPEYELEAKEHTRDPYDMAPKVDQKKSAEHIQSLRNMLAKNKKPT